MYSQLLYQKRFLYVISRCITCHYKKKPTFISTTEGKFSKKRKIIDHRFISLRQNITECFKMSPKEIFFPATLFLPYGLQITLGGEHPNFTHSPDGNNS